MASHMFVFRRWKRNLNHTSHLWYARNLHLFEDKDTNEEIHIAMVQSSMIQFKHAKNIQVHQSDSRLDMQTCNNILKANCDANLSLESTWGIVMKRERF